MSSKPVFILLGCLIALSVPIKHEADGGMTHDLKGLRSYRSAQINEIEELRKEIRGLVASIRGQSKNDSDTVNSSIETDDVDSNETRQFPSTLNHFDKTSTPTLPSRTASAFPAEGTPDHPASTTKNSPASSSLHIYPLPRSNESAAEWNKVLLQAKSHDIFDHTLQPIPKDFVKWQNQ